MTTVAGRRWSIRAVTAALTASAVAVWFGAVAGPASADPTTQCDRSAVVDRWQSGGSQESAAAQTALLGSTVDICDFLTTVGPRRAAVDRRLAANQAVASGGPATRQAAQT